MSLLYSLIFSLLSFLVDNIKKFCEKTDAMLAAVFRDASIASVFGDASIAFVF